MANIVKKDLFEAGLIQSFKEVSVAEAITQKPSRVDGKSITFTKMGTVELHDYTGSINEDEIETDPIVILMDKQKYFAVAVDDIDQVFSTAELLLPITDEASYAIKENVETAIYAKAVATAKAENVIGTTGAPELLASPEMVYDAIVDLGTKLDDNNVPVVNRYVIAKPEIVNMLAKDPRVLLHANQAVLPNGITAIDINGMKVIKSTFAPANTVVCLHNSAIGFGKALDKVEAYRSQKAFADVLRGLVVYGLETLRPEAIAVLHYNI